MSSMFQKDSGPQTPARRGSASDKTVTFYIWINGKLRHLLPATDFAAAMSWADEQYPYAHEREIYRSWQLA